MSHGKKHPHSEQPADFAFSAENEKEAQRLIAKYPKGKQQSAVMPLLMLAQKQHSNWLPVAAMELISRMLGMPYIRVLEVATFYNMYNLEPVGRFHVQCCTTTPCWLKGSDDVLRACKDTAGVGFGETSRDGLFTLSEVECLGACVNAPMLCVADANDGSEIFYEDLDYQRTRELMFALKRGEKPKAGSQSGRVTSEPAGGLTTLESQRAAYDKRKQA